ncbi:odorant receptor 22c-like isoform X4 [Leptopilina boulardi]|uniref:odorant receptor 22c-like isoform X4 n=1 Tax=Leptopilina boulardi TaxID=63433 RepID=UPI0021F68970|nr:odorant receptor 22c-like isoform X4 [Leptopilina boulardi]
MDIVKNPYYNIIRYVIILTGQSQYHSKWLNIWIKSLFFLVILSFIITQMNVVFWKIQNDWDTLTSKHEVDILHKYGRKCRFYSMIFAFGLFGNLSNFVFLHFSTLMRNTLKNNNEPSQLLFLTDFGIDSEKYFYLILLHNYLSASICTAVIVNGDIVLLMFLEHACGVFEIIGNKLTSAIKENSNSTNNVNFRKKLQQEIKLCVSMHRRVLLYVNDVQSVFSTAYLFVFGLSIIDLSITGVQSVMSKNNPEEAIRFGFYTMCQVFHIFLLTLPPQQLLDSSLSLPIYIYNTDWYYLSTETKKMLLLIMKRGSQPTTFIVGKIFIPSLQFFTKVLQTSLSYFTVLISVRG